MHGMIIFMHIITRMENFTTVSTTCRFIDGDRRAPVALASFPGSGNTWVRVLLEKATGVCTGEFIHTS